LLLPEPGDDVFRVIAEPAANLARFRAGAQGARFSGGAIYFDRTRFSGSTVDFRGARFSGGTVDFRGAADWSNPPSFDLPIPPEVKLSAAHGG
jgi:hypothetical protein